MRSEIILLIGSSGQIGKALLPKLQVQFGAENVVAADIQKPEHNIGIFEFLDATNLKALSQLVTKYRITHIYHLAAILSAKGENDPLLTWEQNTQMLLNVLEVSRLQRVSKVFVPSSIAVFGEHAPKYKTPQTTLLNPITAYGISKVDVENWALYYHKRYNLDIRSLRYPGVISYQSVPTNGTTDYAVEIFHKAIQNRPFECFLLEDTLLPMIYIDDVLRATLELMYAPESSISIRTSYNIAGMSFTPNELATEIQKYYPHFIPHYKPDFRQRIAESWPKSIDDSVAQQDWGWKPAFNLHLMTYEMISTLSLLHNQR